MSAAYVEVVGSGSSSGGEVAVSKVTADGIHEVDVQILVRSLAESLLHGQLVAVRCPVGIDGPVCSGTCELEARSSLDAC